MKEENRTSLESGLVFDSSTLPPPLSVKRMDDWASLSVFGFGAMRLAKRSPDHCINETDYQIPTPYDGEGERRPDERGSHFSRKTDACEPAVSTLTPPSTL